MGNIRGRWLPHLILVIGNYVAPGTSHISCLWSKIEIHFFLLPNTPWPSAPTEVAEAKCLLHSRSDPHHCWDSVVRREHAQNMETGEQIKLRNVKQKGKRRIMDSIVIAAACWMHSSLWSQWFLDTCRSHHLRKWKEKRKRWLTMIVNWIYGHSEFFFKKCLKYGLIYWYAG